MKYVPHEYQRFATDFIVTHPTAAIFLDMGGVSFVDVRIN